MARIEDIHANVGIGGPVDYAQQRPSQAFNRMGQQADAAETFLKQIADRDDALEGVSALADFDVERAQRQLHLRTQNNGLDSFVDLAMEDYDAAADKLISAHDNPRVQAFLEQRLVERRASAQTESINWQANAIQQRAEQSSLEIVSKYANMVTSSPGKFQSALADVEAAIDAAGLQLPQADRMRAGARKALSRSAVYGQVETNPHGGLKQLNDGVWDEFLDPDAKISAINAMQSEIKRREGEARATAAMARQEAAFDIDQWSRDNEASLAATGKAVPAPHTDEELKTLLTPGKYEVVKRGEQQAAALFAATGDLASLTISEQNTSLAKTAPVEGQEGFAAQQAIHFAGLARQKQVLTERRENPGAAVLSAFPKVAAAWSAYEASQKPEDLRAALKQSQMAQEALGIPRIDQVLMPNQMIWSIARGVRGASPENAAKQMRGLAESFGPFWPRIFANMSKNLTGHLNVSAVIKDPVAAALLIEGSRQSIADLRKSAGVSDNNDGILKAAADDERVKDFATSLSQRAGGSATATQVVKSIEVLALQRMRVHSEDQADATEGAIKEVVGKNYGFTGEVRTFRVPLEAGDAATIGEGARGYQARLKVDNLDLPDEIKGTGEKWTKEEYIAAIHSKGYWVTNDDESGAILYFERGVPVTVKGKELSLSWKELLDAEQATVYRRDSEKYRRGRQDGVTPTVRAKPDGTGGPAALMPGPAAAAPQGTPRAISAADLASTTDADLLAQTAQPVKEPQISAADASRQLVELGKRGPASVPAWLEDIEAARKKGNKDQRAAAQKYSVEIASLKAAIAKADAAELAQLKDGKTWKLARSLGVLN